MNEISKNIKRHDLLIYVANAYYHYLTYKLSGNKSNLQAYKKCKQGIKHLTRMSIEDINNIIYNVNISNEPIKCLYNQFLEWI